MTNGHPQVPERLGPYVVRALLGEGVMSTVHLAETEGPEGFRKQVAIKVVRPEYSADETFLRMLMREATIGGMLHHPNIVGTLAFEQYGGRYVLVHEFVEGKTSRALLDEARAQGRPGLDPDVALDTMIQACRGMAYAHSLADEQGQPLVIVHRDLKPENLMRTVHGLVKIMDFGIARAKSAWAEVSSAHIVRGSPAYMSPEQVLGRELDGRSDLFSLGSVLYELVTGDVLFPGEKMLTVMQRVAKVEVGDAFERLDAALPGAAQVLRSALAPHPDDRVTDAELLAEQLKALQHGAAARRLSQPHLARMDSLDPSPSMASDLDFDDDSVEAFIYEEQAEEEEFFVFEDLEDPAPELDLGGGMSLEAEEPEERTRPLQSPSPELLGALGPGEETTDLGAELSLASPDEDDLLEDVGMGSQPRASDAVARDVLMVSARPLDTGEGSIPTTGGWADDDELWDDGPASTGSFDLAASLDAAALEGGGWDNLGDDLSDFGGSARGEPALGEGPLTPATPPRPMAPPPEATEDLSELDLDPSLDLSADNLSEHDELLLAEEQAQREVEEQARQEAKEQARREAQEQAQRDAEEQARREAQEQARREAQEQAQRDAEEQARRDAEEQARREAQEQARREALEQARKIGLCEAVRAEAADVAARLSAASNRLDETTGLAQDLSIEEISQALEEVEDLVDDADTRVMMAETAAEMLDPDDGEITLAAQQARASVDRAIEATATFEARLKPLHDRARQERDRRARWARLQIESRGHAAAVEEARERGDAIQGEAEPLLEDASGQNPRDALDALRRAQRQLAELADAARSAAEQAAAASHEAGLEDAHGTTVSLALRAAELLVGVERSAASFREALAIDHAERERARHEAEVAAQRRLREAEARLASALRATKDARDQTAAAHAEAVALAGRFPELALTAELGVLRGHAAALDSALLATEARAAEARADGGPEDLEAAGQDNELQLTGLREATAAAQELLSSVRQTVEAEAERQRALQEARGGAQAAATRAREAADEATRAVDAASRAVEAEGATSPPVSEALDSSRTAAERSRACARRAAEAADRGVQEPALSAAQEAAEDARVAAEEAGSYAAEVHRQAARATLEARREADERRAAREAAERAALLEAKDAAQGAQRELNALHARARAAGVQAQADAAGARSPHLDKLMAELERTNDELDTLRDRGQTTAHRAASAEELGEARAAAHATEVEAARARPLAGQIEALAPRIKALADQARAEESALAAARSRAEAAWARTLAAVESSRTAADGAEALARGCPWDAARVAVEAAARAARDALGAQETVREARAALDGAARSADAEAHALACEQAMVRAEQLAEAARGARDEAARQAEAEVLERARLQELDDTVAASRVRLEAATALCEVHAAEAEAAAAAAVGTPAEEASRRARTRAGEARALARRWTDRDDAAARRDVESYEAHAAGLDRAAQEAEAATADAAAAEVEARAAVEQELLARAGGLAEAETHAEAARRHAEEAASRATAAEAEAGRWPSAAAGAEAARRAATRADGLAADAQRALDSARAADRSPQIIVAARQAAKRAAEASSAALEAGRSADEAAAAAAAAQAEEEALGAARADAHAAAKRVALLRDQVRQSLADARTEAEGLAADGITALIDEAVEAEASCARAVTEAQTAARAADGAAGSRTARTLAGSATKALLKAEEAAAVALDRCSRALDTARESRSLAEARDRAQQALERATAAAGAATDRSLTAEEAASDAPNSGAAAAAADRAALAAGRAAREAARARKEARKTQRAADAASALQHAEATDHAADEAEAAASEASQAVDLARRAADGVAEEELAAEEAERVARQEPVQAPAARPEPEPEPEPPAKIELSVKAEATPTPAPTPRRRRARRGRSLIATGTNNSVPAVSPPSPQAPAPRDISGQQAANAVEPAEDLLVAPPSPARQAPTRAPAAPAAPPPRPRDDDLMSAPTARVSSALANDMDALTSIEDDTDWLGDDNADLFGGDSESDLDVLLAARQDHEPTPPPPPAPEPAPQPEPQPKPEDELEDAWDDEWDPWGDDKTTSRKRPQTRVEGPRHIPVGEGAPGPVPGAASKPAPKSDDDDDWDPNWNFDDVDDPPPPPPPPPQPTPQPARRPRPKPKPKPVLEDDAELWIMEDD